MNAFDEFFVGSVAPFDGRVVQVREEIFSIEVCLDVFEESNFSGHGLKWFSWDDLRTTKRL